MSAVCTRCWYNGRRLKRRGTLQRIFLSEQAPHHAGHRGQHKQYPFGAAWRAIHRNKQSKINMPLVVHRPLSVWCRIHLHQCTGCGSANHLPNPDSSTSLHGRQARKRFPYAMAKVTNRPRSVCFPSHPSLVPFWHIVRLPIQISRDMFSLFGAMKHSMFFSADLPVRCSFLIFPGR